MSVHAYTGRASNMSDSSGKKPKGRRRKLSVENILGRTAEEPEPRDASGSVAPGRARSMDADDGHSTTPPSPHRAGGGGLSRASISAEDLAGSEDAELHLGTFVAKHKGEVRRIETRQAEELRRQHDELSAQNEAYSRQVGETTDGPAAPRPRRSACVKTVRS